jgi:hypothetical protein
MRTVLPDDVVSTPPCDGGGVLTTSRPAVLLPGPLLALLGGLALGVVTNVLQGVLPGVFQAFANSGSVWVAGAFTAGALLRRRGWWAVAAGTATQVGAVVGYYGFAEFARDGMGSPVYPLFWLVLGLVAGPVFGTAGAWWRSGEGWRGIAGPGLLAAVFGMDALWYLVVLQYHVEAIVYGVIAVLILVLLGRTLRERLLGLAFAAPLAALAAVLLNLVSAVPASIG